MKTLPLFQKMAGGLLIALVLLACTITTPWSARPAVEPVTVVPVQPTLSAPQPISLPPTVMDEQTLMTELYQRVNPSVVHITTYIRDGNMLSSSGLGSGFVYDAQGHIVTNAHVVQGADDLDVVFSDNTTLIGKVVGLDLNSDLAVVKVDALPDGVQPLPLADPNSLAVGQTVLAIGNPFGLDGTLTRGIISALGRTIPALTTFNIPEAIQTDAPINPGNSGGPLLNLQGEVIGVNAQIETGGTGRSNSGVGFAIPVSIVRLVVPDLIATGEHAWAWLGVRGGSLSVVQAEAMELPVQKGAYLSEIIAGGPAAKADLRGSTGMRTLQGRQVEVGGDVIIAIDQQPVEAFEDVLTYVSLRAAPGQTVTLTILRDGEQLQVPVTLEKRPDSLQP